MIKVLLEGQSKQVENLVRSFQSLNYYHVFHQSYLTKNRKNDSDVRLELFLMNEPKKRKVTCVRLNTDTGAEILINLLDAKVIEIEDGVKYINGNNYDIFAHHKGSIETKAVDIEDVD